jgi:hypothetical protein
MAIKRLFDDITSIVGLNTTDAAQAQNTRAINLAVMFAAMIGLARNEQAGGTRSNTLMRWRVGLQFTTVVLFILLLLLRG